MSGGYQGGGMPDWRSWLSVAIYLVAAGAGFWFGALAIDWIAKAFGL